MATYDPAIRGKAYEFYVALEDLATPGSFKANPTIAAGDFKIDLAGTLTNLTTLPSVDPASSIWVKIPLSATEMTRDTVKIQAIDQTATKEWADRAWSIPTTNGQAAAKELYATSGTVWHVGEGGDDAADGLSWETRLATLTQAITNHASNDVIVLRGAITNNSAAGTMLAGASIVNAIGQPRAKISTTFNTSGGVFLKPGNRCVIRGFEMAFSDAGGNVYLPIALTTASGDTAKTDVLIEDIHISGSAPDGVYTTATNCTNWVIRRCRFHTVWDAIAVFASGTTWIIEDCEIIGLGPSPTVGSQPIQGITLNAGEFIVRRNRIKVSGGETANYCISLQGGGTVHLYDNVFDSSGTTPLDISSTGGTCIDYGGNRGSGTGGALTTSGSITNRKSHYQPDWSTINAPTTTQNLSATTIKTATDVETDTQDIQTKIGTPAGASVSADIAAIEAQTDDIGVAGAGLTAITGKTDLIPAAPASTTNITAGTITTVTNLTNAPTAGDLTATMKASVNAEVLDVLNVDTFAEIGQETPAATQTIRKMLAYLYKGWRNKKTKTATTFSLFNDDAATVDQKCTTTDDATTFTSNEMTTGP